MMSISGIPIYSNFHIFFLIPAKSLLTPKTDADVFQAKAKETLTIFLHNFLS